MIDNQVYLLGYVVSGFKFFHEFKGEKFFEFLVEVERSSGTTDTLPVVISERLIDVNKNIINHPIYIEGSFRSRNIKQDNKTHLSLYVFADDAYTTDETHSINRIILNGYVCKEPTYRKTPFGRTISDLIVASNRRFGKTDYLPCVAWGRTAIVASTLNVGSYVAIEGRIQSREYTKDNERRIAYEVSIIEMQ